MATALATPKLSDDDPLDYLPAVPIIKFEKGRLIYNHGDPADYLYLVNDGFVRISNMTAVAQDVLIDIYRTEEFFGERSFHPAPVASSQCAIALSDVKVMRWPVQEICGLMMNRPRLALAFIKLQVRQNMASVARIESSATEELKHRLARALLYFNARLGEMPMTHELLSQYLGSSRELVTCQMVLLRKAGLIQYSRRGLVVDAVKLREWLEK